MVLIKTIIPLEGDEPSFGLGVILFDTERKEIVIHSMTSGAVCPNHHLCSEKYLFIGTSDIWTNPERGAVTMSTHIVNLFEPEARLTRAFTSAVISLEFTDVVANMDDRFLLVQKKNDVKRTNMLEIYVLENLEDDPDYEAPIKVVDLKPGYTIYHSLFAAASFFNATTFYMESDSTPVDRDMENRQGCDDALFVFLDPELGLPSMREMEASALEHYETGKKDPNFLCRRVNWEREAIHSSRDCDCKPKK